MAVETPTPFGQAVRRKEDPRFITGTGNYVEDIVLPGTLSLTIVRSPYGHARIRSINAEAARAAPGVEAVFTGEDMQRTGVGAVPPGWLLPDIKIPTHPALAVDKVRFQGDAVAAIVATSRAAADDAAELLEVEYEQLPAVVDVEKALAPGAPLVHDDIPDNTSFVWRISGGDVQRAFREADRVVEQRLVNQRLIPNAIEMRGTLARFERSTDQLTLWSSTQIPHLVRLLLALTLNHPEHHLRVISPDVGGAFGSKLHYYPEELITAWVARMLPGRPIRWIPSRSEDYQATIHGRDHVENVAFAVMNDGTITAIRVDTVANMGAYLSTFGPLIPTILFALILSGPYRIPNIECEVKGVLTNTVMVDAYRGAGRPEATYLIERMVDLVAGELGMDPAEIRRRNFIPPDDFPYSSPTGVIYDSGNYAPTLEKALQAIGYDALRREQEEARKQGRYLGIGFSSYVEICGLAPSHIAVGAGAQAGVWESAEVRVLPTGKVTVFSGACWHGQGHDTGFAQIVSTELGVPMEDIEVVHGDTEAVQYGIGTFGSRSAAVGGVAVHASVQKVIEKCRRLAAHMLEANVDDVRYENGKAFVAGSPDRALTLQELALSAFLANNRPEDMEPGLSETTLYDPTNFTWPFGTHISVVEVDPKTGAVKLLRYLAVDDCGRVINPMLKDGQIHGGVAQGIAQALYEHAVYNQDGALVTGTMADYALPTAIELPQFETEATVTPSPVNPLGVKGIGEAGTIASTACVANAVMDALRPFGIRHVDMPLTPETVWRAIHQGGES
jgi:carbon-monoxide dehydrogenase large subunit